MEARKVHLYLKKQAKVTERRNGITVTDEPVCVCKREGRRDGNFKSSFLKTN